MTETETSSAAAEAVAEALTEMTASPPENARELRARLDGYRFLFDHLVASLASLESYAQEHRILAGTRIAADAGEMVTAGRNLRDLAEETLSDFDHDTRYWTAGE